MRLEDETDAPAPSELAPALEGVRVLLVDDEEDVTDVYSRALRQHGAVVEATLDGEEGLGALRAQRFDIVISDLDMPRLDGIEMVRVLRSEKGSDPPAIAISGSVRPDVVQTALGAGFDAFATKPVPPSALVEAVLKLLRRRAR